MTREISNQNDWITPEKRVRIKKLFWDKSNDLFRNSIKKLMSIKFDLKKKKKKREVDTK